MEECLDLGGNGAVALEIRGYQNQLWAKAQCSGGRHRRAYAEGARGIVAGGDDAALLGAATDGDGHLAPLGMAEHLDGGIEAIAVGVEDLAHARIMLKDWMAVQWRRPFIALEPAQQRQRPTGRKVLSVGRWHVWHLAWARDCRSADYSVIAATQPNTISGML